MKSKQEFCTKIKQVIEDVSLGVHQAASIADTSKLMADLNLDSLDYASILLGTESWSGLKVNEDGIRWAEIDSVEKLADLFIAAQAK